MSVQKRIKLLPQSDDNNGWLRILDRPLPPANRLQKDMTADYAVIGAGFTGLAAARRLAELRPDSSVVLIEAGRVGNNSSGRNSGFAIDQAHDIRASNFGGNLATEKRQIRINRIGQDYLRAAVKRHGIECGWDERGKIHASASAKGEAKLRDYRAILDRLEAPNKWLNAADMKRITGSDYYTGGILTPGTILIQPAAMVRGLADSLPENVSLFEDSPITAIDYGTPPVIRIDKTRISASQIVLTANIFAGQFGFFKDCMIPIATWSSLTRPMTRAEQAAIGGETHWGIIPADPFGSSLRRVGSRLLIRNTYSYSAKINTSETMRIKMRARHARSLRRRFPALPDLAPEFTWGGPLALSRNGQPVFGALRANVHGAFCLNGVGVARGTAYGRLLAQHILGEACEMSRHLAGSGRPNHLPPKPFLGWGVDFNLLVRRLRAGAEL